MGLILLQRLQWHIRPRRFCVLSGRSLCFAVVCIEVIEDLSLLAVGGVLSICGYSGLVNVEPADVSLEG